MTARCAAVVALIFMGLSPAMAWNKPTHMVVAAIAYDQLRAQSPDSLTMTLMLLKSHPDYRLRWLPQMRRQRIAPSDEALFLFMQAARWPDDIRGKQTGYEQHREWHYVNIPVRLGIAGGRADLEPERENILIAFERNIAIVRSGAPRSRKAIALCWIFHLVGDVHQPLHTTKLLSELFPPPMGDRGGNSFFIRVQPTGRTMNLHAFWDDVVLGSDRFRSVRDRAILLQSDYSRTRLPELAEMNFDNWARRESYQTALSNVYLNGELPQSADKTNGTLLPRDYTARAKRIGERRVTLAGYRLADLLGVLL